MLNGMKSNWDGLSHPICVVRFSVFNQPHVFILYLPFSLTRDFVYCCFGRRWTTVLCYCHRMCGDLLHISGLSIRLKPIWKWKHDRSTRKTTMDGSKENEGSSRKKYKSKHPAVTPKQIRKRSSEFSDVVSPSLPTNSDGNESLPTRASMASDSRWWSHSAIAVLCIRLSTQLSRRTKWMFTRSYGMIGEIHLPLILI